MEKKTLRLVIVSQEKLLLDEAVDSVTAPTTTGEVTILPSHIPLLTQLQPGELIYKSTNGEDSLVVSKGFLEMSPEDTLTVIVDSAVLARDISVEKAQEAIKRAQETMASTVDRHEVILAEASLKQAMWEIKVAQKTRKSKI